MNAKIKSIGNSFYKANLKIKSSVKNMKNEEFHRTLTILILGSIIAMIPIALSYLTTNIRITNAGKILTEKVLITHKSEIRGVFIHEEIYGVSRNWTKIAETLANYGINAVFVNDQGGTNRRSDSEISQAISAFHSYGIEYHSAVRVLGSTPDMSGELCMVKSNGEIYSNYWICPIKAHDTIINNLADYLNDHPDVDGIMLDYIRYDVADNCYCLHCRAAFQEWLGENITDWTPFYPDGSRWSEYAEWRTIPITTLVKDIHDLVKSVNPNIVISEAAWTLFSDSATYWRKWIGQDTAKWIAEGYIEFVAPMMYQKTIYGSGDEALESRINAVIKYWMGGQPEGKMPLVAFLRTDWIGTDLTPEEFAAQVDYVRSRGLDGWIIWRYSGPGGYIPNARNIIDYLSAIDLPNTFLIRNIQVSVGSTNATITWLTDLPATSKVEYSTAPLFGAVLRTQNGFNFWNITYTLGMIESSDANVTKHSITLTDLAPNTTYYFRIQSQDTSGIITSEIKTFTTSA